MLNAIKGDITKITAVQAIVNAANQTLLGGGGVDGAIHRVAGPQLLEECRTLHGCQTGEAKITKAYNLPCDYVIHTVGPIWHGGYRGEADLLASCYTNSLKVAVENGIRTIAFPSISTGVYSYPVEQAAAIAVGTVNRFVTENPGVIDEVTWVLFDERTYQVYEREIQKMLENGSLNIDKVLEDPNVLAAYIESMDLANLAIIAPHKEKYIGRYDIHWLINSIKEGRQFEYTTFWIADDGYENNVLSQWYKGEPFYINGRKYYTAEQYMMSEKALLFHDLDSYEKIMAEPDPCTCKHLGRKVKNYDHQKWEKASREIVFHGNLGKLQSDIRIVAALLGTGDSVLIEASPKDDIYGAGLEKKDLLNPDGTLKVLPQDWHKQGETKQAENRLGFILMGIRDLFRDLMPGYKE